MIETIKQWLAAFNRWMAGEAPADYPGHVPPRPMPENAWCPHGIDRSGPCPFCSRDLHDPSYEPRPY